MANQPKKHFLAEIEEKLLKQWEAQGVFAASLRQREGAERFNFYDGPPFANGTPHYGHLEQTAIKDSVTRYKTMQGYYVPRRVGWDTHGLPVEYAIEKKHGFTSKKDIVAYGIDKFNQECRDSVFEFKDVWEKMFRRVGRWADYDHTYATLDESYIESVWWVFKTIHDKGLVYKDFRSSPYCPRCATPLSNFELNQGYQDDVTDPSLYVKFKLADEDAYLLGWTTTPWSLPGNAAIAVNPDAEYVYVELKDDEGLAETVVLARKRLEVLNSDDYRIIKEVHGRDLVGRRYEPPFKLWHLDRYAGHQNLYQVWPADFVSIDDGTGVLHVAPAFGEDDLMLGKQHQLPVLLTVDENGHVVKGIGIEKSIGGLFFKDADPEIIAQLTHEGKVFAAESLQHTYPFCWRCDTPLLYYATDNWLVKVSAVRDQLVKNNQQINWTPEHIQEGRFGNWLAGARDWGISRNRFWGAPLPVWVTKDGKETVVIGSLKELKARAVNPEAIGDLHRPYIDKVVLKTDSGQEAYRIPEVFDCWFESGAMPYGQDHYPFANKAQWSKGFPADFIAEAVDQTRGWFYTLHVLATALFDKPAFQNAICSGWITAADGEKLSKRKKNYAPMDDIFDQYGVDSMRFFMVSSPLVNGEDVRFSTDFLRDVQRKVFMSLNNIFSFYKLYADVDDWQPSKPLQQPTSSNLLDRWILARLNQTIDQVTKAMDDYRLDKATRPLADLLDDTSNWYVRRSRRRFWKSEDDHDKQQAYATLHYTLLRLCQLLAPFAPFLPDHIWGQLVAGTSLPSSVHLSDWPEAGKLDSSVLEQMEQVRSEINEALSQRARAGVKVRQPLQKVAITSKNLPEDLKVIVAEEVNVKEVVVAKNVTLDIKLTPELKREGLMRDVIRLVQNARKQADLQVDDRIKLSLSATDRELIKAIAEHSSAIAAETLTVGKIAEGTPYQHQSEATVEGNLLKIALEKSDKS